VIILALIIHDLSYILGWYFVNIQGISLFCCLSIFGIIYGQNDSFESSQMSLWNGFELFLIIRGDINPDKVRFLSEHVSYSTIEIICQ